MRTAVIALLAVLLGVSACSTQHVFAPPSRGHTIAPVRALPAERRAVELDLATAGSSRGSDLGGGSARMRFGIGNNSEVSVEGTVVSVERLRGSHELYTGRVGVRKNPGRGPIAVQAGAGGGFSAYGGPFVSADAGVAFGIPNCTLVPVWELAGYVSRSLASHEVDEPMADEPSFIYGFIAHAGLRLALTPAACRRGESAAWVTLGATVTAAADDDAEDLLGYGLGIEVPLD